MGKPGILGIFPQEGAVMNEILRTPRLILRELTGEDLEDLKEIHQDEETMTAYAHAFSEEEVKAWLQRNLERYAKDGIGLWAVILRETGEFVGRSGAHLAKGGGGNPNGSGLFAEKVLLASGVRHGSRQRLHGLRFSHFGR
jgi:RimJ/RimL family protein N-acetyltransferase